LKRFVLDASLAKQGIGLEYSQDIAPARGTSLGCKITLLPGQSPAEEFATLSPELAHLCDGETYEAQQSKTPISRGVSDLKRHIIGSV
jgi:hypothetical protein